MGAAVALGAWAAPAHAEIIELADRVAQAYSAEGATVARVPPRFLYEDEVTLIPLAPPPSARCVTVALVAARGMSFHGGFDDASDEESEQAQSIAGTLEMTSCGAPPTRLRLESDAGRGAVEIVVAWSRAPLAPLRAYLPERLGGMLPPMIDPGAVPTLPPQAARVDAAEARLRATAAIVEPRTTVKATADSGGALRLELAPGCHQLHLFAQEARGIRTGRARIDLDAELHDDKRDETLAKDDGDAPDAVLDTCVGAPTTATLHFEGAQPSSDVVILHAQSRLPDAIPSLWGATARARMAGALGARSIRLPPTTRATLLLSGAVGTNLVPIVVEPGACYVAVVAGREGAVRTLSVRAAAGERESLDEHGSQTGSAAVAFCAGAADRARVSVDFRGSPSGWALALFRVASGIWEAP
jgi:hypothetical protein